MYSSDEKFAPYASIGNVISVIRRYRDYGTPKIIDLTEMQKAGVSEGNASRTLVTLRFLGLIEENGEPSPLFLQLNKARSDEYSKVLGDIVRNAYTEIFNILNPEVANDIEINDAFRGFSPSKQRDRMASLFLGLCKEAGIISGEPETHRKVASKPETKTRNRGAAKIKPVDKIRESNVSYWFGQLKTMLDKLPPAEEAHWPKTTRDKWIQALTALLDLLIDVEEP